MGGVERVAIELANSVQEKDHKLSLIDFSGDNEFFYKVNKNIERPKAIKPRNFRRKIIGKLLRFNNSIKKKSSNGYVLYKEQTIDLINYLKRENFDVLIMNQGVLTALIPIVKKEIPHLKVVAWQHNEYEIYMNQYNKKIIKDYLLGVEQADLLVCLTEEDQKKFSNLNKNSTFIYNPLTITNNEKKVSRLTNKQIIFVGRLKLEQKGLDYLIELGKNLKDGWTILVAGDGEDKNSFIQMIKKNSLEDQIILKGPLKSEELVDFYLSGSIFISTSRWEGFGLVITEAMSFGLPIISFDNSGPREILKNGQNGILVEKNNIKEFSVRLNELVEDHKKREYFQKKSLERVKDFKREVIIKEWESKLNSI
jgi:glycosyltransferase involved in cell wall biosynthesis